MAEVEGFEALFFFFLLLSTTEYTGDLWLGSGGQAGKLEAMSVFKTLLHTLYVSHKNVATHS